MICKTYTPLHGKMTHRFTRLLIFSLGLFAFLSVNAAPVHVEVVVFANKTKNNGLEWFVKRREVIKIEEFEFIDPIESQAPDSSPSGPEPAQAYVLTEFVRAVEESPNFELLNYISWVQEPVPRSRTKSISLDIPHADSMFSTELLLAGETSVYEIAQLLQFDIHVTYKPIADKEKDSVNLPELVKLYEPEVAYVLEEKRQVHINDIHYFDHPEFGVVFAIVRPELPELNIQ